MVNLWRSLTGCIRNQSALFNANFVSHFLPYSRSMLVVYRKKLCSTLQCLLNPFMTMQTMDLPVNSSPLTGGKCFKLRIMTAYSICGRSLVMMWERAMINTHIVSKQHQAYHLSYVSTFLIWDTLTLSCTYYHYCNESQFLFAVSSKSPETLISRDSMAYTETTWPR